MILYQLCCEDGHDFEAWFHDHRVYGELVAQGQVECPYCGSTQVTQMRLVCDIFKSRSGDAPEETLPKETSAYAASVEDGRKARDVAQRILNAVGKIHDYAKAHYEDIGMSEDDEVDFFRLAAHNRRDH